MKKTIAVIFGGRSVEHDVSIITAHLPIIESLAAAGTFDVWPVYIAKDGSWYCDKQINDLVFFKTDDFESALKRQKKVQLLFDNGLYIIWPGIRRLGMGILVGLHDWREDLTSLIRHVKLMKKKYWQTEFTVSLPRLRPCASDFVAPSPVSDTDYIEMICRTRLEFPDVGIVLSTREAPEFRNRLIAAGVTQMSAGSRTDPGGYLHPDENLKQFEIEDNRTPAEVAAAIVAKGYEPVWKDW